MPSTGSPGDLKNRFFMNKETAMTTPVNDGSKRLIVASYRLPFKAVEHDGEKTIEQSAGGLVSAMASISRTSGGSALYRSILWVGKAEGTPGDYSLINETRPQFRLEPVVIEKAVDDKYYGGFCNDLLWPLFHYFPSLVVLDESYFENYLTANRAFADTIASLAEPGDFIWVHDYQLFLLPLLLRNKLPDATIGFFLHIPFPTFEIFRIMPRRWCEAILKGMLGADLIGFHTFDYCQYFLRTVARVLGHEVTMNSVSVYDRLVRVDDYPLGIDFTKFNDAALNSKEVADERTKNLATLKNQKLIFSIDRLDYSKGLLHRLVAYEYFLDAYPQWVGNVVFNMVVIPSRDTIPRYQEMKREIESTVGRINGKYSTIEWRPLVYQYKSLSFSELVSLYDLSDVGLITPIRDGMNLVAKEYIACQTSGKGVLVLSETAGAASELSETLLINPTDKQEVADALHRALSMPRREREILITRMQDRIRRYTVFTWAHSIVTAVEAIKKEQDLRKVNMITPSTESAIMERFASADQRVLFIDYDGTLVPFSRVPELGIPTAATMAQLKRLTDDPATTVVIISGRNKDFMEEWFGNVAVHCIAEHGAFLKAPQKEWECTIDPDQSWKAEIMPILQKYLDRCNGSFIEEKFSSLGWHYRNAPYEIASERAKELTEELRTAVAHESKLHVLEGAKVVEVKRTGYDKGTAASKFIAGGLYDCIIALGDDRTDEDLFRALPPEAISIKVGIKSTLAKYNLRDQFDVAGFLERLIKTGERRHA
jgi:trehalose 6-phosphate synthase/phosphatase